LDVVCIYQLITRGTVGYAFIETMVNTM